MYQAVKDMLRNKKELLVNAEAQTWHRQCVLTPDIWKLEQSMYQLIFVPDDMMRGRINNHLIADAGKDGDVPVHPACFTFDRYTMFKKDLGEHSFPIPMDKTFEPSGYLRVKPVPAKIKGQLYAILSPQIIKLDIHRQNGLLFRRERREISLPYRHVKYNDKPDAEVYSKLPVISPYFLKTVTASMYVGIPEYWDNLISDMFTVRECNKEALNQPQFWVDEYYRF